MANPGFVTRDGYQSYDNDHIFVKQLSHLRPKSVICERNSTSTIKSADVMRDMAASHISSFLYLFNNIVSL